MSADLHPAALAAMSTATPTLWQMTEEIWSATFAPAQSKVVFAMLQGYRELGIEWTPMRDADPERLSHIMLIYSGDTLRMLLRDVDGSYERLEARGAKAINFREIAGEGFLTIAWPISEVIKLAEVWADTDAAGFTVFGDFGHGLVCGTIQPF